MYENGVCLGVFFDEASARALLQAMQAKRAMLTYRAQWHPQPGGVNLN